MKTCTLSYINEEYPPPYKYHFEAVINLQSGETTIKQHYLDRATLEMAEIEEAGFSQNDDFSWKGHLEGNWIAYLDHLVTKYSMVSNGSGKIVYGGSGQEVEVFPNNLDMEMLIQAMIQAVLEGKAEELPLSVGVQLQDAAKPYMLNIRFKTLDASVQLPEGSIKQTDWDATLQFVQSIYMSDFDEYASSSHKPMQGKFCISLEPEVWLYADEALEKRNKFPDFGAAFRKLLL